MRNILITGIGGDVACAIIRCLLDNNKKDNIFGIDIKEYTPYMDLLAKTFIAPGYRDKEYMPYIKNLIKDYNITHFLPTSEQEIILADKERVYFEEQNVKILINTPLIVDICTSKYKTAEFLRNHGIDAPMTFYAENYCDGLEYPFIMKSDSGCGSKNLHVIHNEDEWFLADKQGMICQQMVGSSDTEYTVGVFSNGKIVNSITLKRRLGYGGLSALVECCNIPAIDEIANKAAKAFGLRGSFNIQLRQDGEKYYIFEINPRLSSTTGFRHKFGFRDAVWWFDMMDGNLVPEFKKSVEGLIGVKVLDDMVISVIRGGYRTSRIIRYSGNGCQVMAA